MKIYPCRFPSTNFRVHFDSLVIPPEDTDEDMYQENKGIDFSRTGGFVEGSSSSKSGFSMPSGSGGGALKIKSELSSSDSPPLPHHPFPNVIYNRPSYPVSSRSRSPTNPYNQHHHQRISPNKSQTPLKINIPDPSETNFSSPFPSPTGTIR